MYTSITNVTPSPSLQLPIGNTFTLTGQGKSEILKESRMNCCCCKCVVG